MTAYATVKVKVFIHNANPGDETGDVGTMARDIQDHIETLDSTAQSTLIITHTSLAGDRILTLICGGT
tara:strand:+ start:750 stop:953 length:204 start_codon:yes stop_codon:yes gene_type:complete